MVLLPGTVTRFLNRQCILNTEHNRVKSGLVVFGGGSDGGVYGPGVNVGIDGLSRVISFFW